MTTELKEKTEVRRTPFGAAKPVSIILAVLLAFSMFAASMLGVVRTMLSEDGIERIVSSLMSGSGSAAVPGGYEYAAARETNETDDILKGLTGDQIMDMAREYGVADICDDLGVTSDNVMELLERSTFRQFASKHAAAITKSLLEKGTISGVLDTDTVVDFVRENEEVLYDVTGKQITEEHYDKLRERLPGVISNIEGTVEGTVGGIKESVGVGLTFLTGFVSTAVYICAIAAAVIFAAVIFVMHKFLIGRSLTFIAIPAITVGVMLFAVSAVLFFIGGSVMDGALVGVFSAVNVTVIVRAVLYAVVGAALLFAGIPLRRRGI